MSFRERPLNHMLAMTACLRRLGAEGRVDLRDYSLEVRARGRRLRFTAQFCKTEDGRRMYTPVAEEPGVNGFIGWLPYFNKRWPAGSAKLPFKAFCVERGLRTPKYSLESPEGMADYIIKTDNSSFGTGIWGPFRAGTAQALPPGGYYEEFVPGTVLKAWFWSNRLVALELDEMAHAVGDGKSTVRELVAALCVQSATVNADWMQFEQIAAFAGLGLEDVPAPGRRFLADFRYSSVPSAYLPDNRNRLSELAGGPIVAQVVEFGSSLLESIPPEVLGDGALYTVDAIADRDARVWLLEMNCNPSMHPDCYPGIFESLFASPTAAARPTPALSVTGIPRRLWRYC